MEPEQARKDAEALRYRLHVRLGAILREARAQSRSDLIREAERLRAALVAVEVGPDEGSTEAARRRFEGIRAALPKLQAELRIADHDRPALAKWLELVVFAVPGLALLLAVIVIFERRRRKREISAAALAALDRPRDASRLGSRADRR